MAKNKTFRLALVAEDPTENEKLAELFEKNGVHVTSLSIGDIALLVKKGEPGLVSKEFKDLDAVFMQAPPPLLLFVEPFLNELMERGIYCQLKPISFNLLCNKPLMYATLNARNVPIQKTTLIPEGGNVAAALKKFAYPVYLEAFHELDKTQQMLIEDKSQLTSYLKSIPFTYDVLTAKEFAKVDMHVSIVIGDEVFTAKQKWVEADLAHAQDMTKAACKHKEIILHAVKTVGLDIALVKTKGNTVVGMSATFDMEAFPHNIHEKIVDFYLRRLG
ncbi:MAG: hypothetical protein OXR66_00920 [Candidatus Woesearchaeota archaeon]|nr:hypothetical protein [Candidatus Woesearchaeota archaeon]